MKKTSLYKLIYFLMFLFISIIGNGQEILDNYLTTAAKNNPGLQAKFNEYMAALEIVPQVGTLPDPQVAFGYFIQPVETRVGPQRAKISASQMFPWFGTLNAKEDVATQRAKAKYEEFEDAKSKLFYNIKSTWYNLYFTQSALNITKENIEIVNTFKKLALVKIETGKVSAVDELRVEIEILDLDNQLKYLKDKLYAQNVEFNNLLNVDENSQVTIPDLLDTVSLTLNRETLLDSIRTRNHQVLGLEFQQASFEYQQIVAKKMGNPNFSIGLDYVVIGESSNPSLSASESGKDAFVLPKVGISIPIYRKKYTSMVKEAVFMQQATENKKADKINMLETLFERANSDYLDANRRIKLNTSQLNLSNKALRILESEYATDNRNFEEILRMDRQVLMYSLELEKSRCDINASVAFINYLMGR